MANKLLLGVLALAMIASTASASRFMDAFIVTADDPTVNNLIIQVFDQIWFFAMPIAAGPMYLMFNYVWENATQETDVNGTMYDFKLSELLAYAGVGNFDMFFDLILSIGYKFALS